MQAINLYGERPYLQPELQEARDFLQATEHSKQLTNAFRGDIQKYWDELESARRKLQVRLHFTRCLPTESTLFLTASSSPCWQAAASHMMQNSFQGCHFIDMSCTCRKQ